MGLPYHSIKILRPVLSCRNDELIHACKLQIIEETVLLLLVDSCPLGSCWLIVGHWSGFQFLSSYDQLSSIHYQLKIGCRLNSFVRSKR